MVRTDVDCPHPLGLTITVCRDYGHPLIHLGVLIVAVGVLAAVLFLASVWRGAV